MVGFSKSGRGLRTALASLLVLLVAGALARAQDFSSILPPSGQGRQLAPGVVHVIRSTPEEQGSFTGPRPFAELIDQANALNWQPRTFAAGETALASARQTIFRRTVWQLEFGFKPLRTIRMDMPDGQGGTQSVVVYYLMYYVRNAGGHLQPAPADPDLPGVYSLEPAERTLRFVPRFQLQGHDHPATYMEKILPRAVEQIRQKEDPRQPLYDTVTISRVVLPVSQDNQEGKVWGVATWVGVDPRTDFLSVLVQGLTNAYDWQVQPDGQKAYQFRTLKLHFWRPGDAVREDEDAIQYGIPFVEDPAEQARLLEVYGVEDRVDHQWIYQ